MTIHTVGDSHCFNGWTDVVTHYLEGTLCYSFCRDKLDRCDIRKYNIKDGDSIIFSFGEIDCRYHIHKYINNTNTYKDIINPIINNYFETIKFHINISGIKFKNICVYNLPPPCRDNPQTIGSNEERKMYTLYFNQKLKEKCIENNFIYFDIYDNCTDEHGFLSRNVSNDNLHIHDVRFTQKFIKDHNI